jgi:hypothetical protein
MWVGVSVAFCVEYNDGDTRAHEHPLLGIVEANQRNHWD